MICVIVINKTNYLISTKDIAMKKTIKLIICLLSVCAAFSSCKNQDKESKITMLFPTCDVFNESDDYEPLVEFLNRGKIVRLEANDSSLIGGFFHKYLKRDSLFYVRSFNDVIVFDADGKYLRKLSKMGNGKDEYGRIQDFDVINRDNRQEIWVSSNRDINRYDAESLESVGKISTDDYVHNFIYVNDSTIISMGSGEKTLSVIDIEGKVRQTYLDKDMANIVHCAVQFRRLGDRVIYHINDTYSAVIYSPSDDSFSTIEVLPISEKIASVETNQEYYEKYGYMDFTSRVSEDFTTLSAFQISGPQYILTSMHPGKTANITLGNDKESFTWEIPGDVLRLKDSININWTFLRTLIACDNDHGFMFMLSSDDIEGEDPDANPSLLVIE